MVIAAERLVAIWTFARSRGQAFVNTFLAEDMPTGLDDGVLEVALTNRANRQSLLHLVPSQ